MKGQAFVTFANENSAHKALKATNGLVLNSKPMAVVGTQSDSGRLENVGYPQNCLKFCKTTTVFVNVLILLKPYIYHKTTFIFAFFIHLSLKIRWKNITQKLNPSKMSFYWCISCFSDWFTLISSNCGKSHVSTAKIYFIWWCSKCWVP